MHEAGIVKRNEENLLPLRFRQETEEIPSSVSLMKASPIFIVFIVGIAVAMFFLLLEMLAHKMKRKSHYSGSNAKTSVFAYFYKMIK
jgi:hypothetical protein